MSYEELMKLAVNVTVSKVQSSSVPANQQSGADTGSYIEEVYLKLIRLHDNHENRHSN